MSRTPKYSKEIKIKVCEDYQKGKETFQSIAKLIGANREVVRQWYLKYKEHGATAFETSNHNRSYSKNFKISVIEEYTAGKYSMADLSAKYDIAYSVLKKWVRKWYNGIDIEDYDPKGDIYTMKSRKTTFEERLEIVIWVIENDLNYKLAADKFDIKYALVYQWVKKYMKNGSEGLRHKKKGPKPKSEVDEETLSEVDKLKLELEREKVRRQRAELRLELLKKKEEFEQKLSSRK